MTTNWINFSINIKNEIKMKRKYKTMTANQKSGKHRSIEEMAIELLAFQNAQNEKKKKKKKKEQYDDDDSAGMEHIQNMLDNF